MIICKECGKIVSYNSYFKGYFCSECGYFISKSELQTEKGKLNNKKVKANDMALV